MWPGIRGGCGWRHRLMEAGTNAGLRSSPRSKGKFRQRGSAGSWEREKPGENPDVCVPALRPEPAKPAWEFPRSRIPGKVRDREGAPVTTGKVYVFDHPLILHKLTILRDKRTGHKEFRELVEELAMLMAFEVTRAHPTREVEVETPLATMKGRSIAGQEIAVIPILRAGLAMEVGVSRLIPTARIGRSEEHTSELQSQSNLVCRLLLE